MEKVVTVWLAANEYQEASKLCHEHYLGWAAAINSALAIEIYLKSLSSTELKVPIGIGEIYQSFAETEKGHDFIDLFNKIDEPYRKKIIDRSFEINSAIDLEALLLKYKDVFVKARYLYEKNAHKFVSSEIVELAEHLRKVVESVGRDIIG